METVGDLSRTRPGFRLHRLELFNWGTFDSLNGTIYSVVPEGRTTLLVGQNGSGKSTIVDAILTLLVPSSIRNYNVAAGAKKTERNERSYVRGAYGRASDSDQSAITQYLRPGTNYYSAILGVFKDENLDQAFTVCQILYQSNAGDIEKIFAFSDSARRLKEDLADIKAADAVKSRLVECGYRTTKKYVEYSHWIAKTTGYRSKAMDMFNQTVAVKDIQSLNDFIRNHMLEPNDWREKITKLQSHFGELTSAHRELVRIRHAKELLEPIERVGAEFLSRSSELNRNEHMLDAVDLYFRVQTIRIYEPLIAEHRDALREATNTKRRLTARLGRLNESIRSLKNEIEHAAGDRLRSLPMLIDTERVALESKLKEHARMESAMLRVGIDLPTRDRFEFDAVRKSAKMEAGLVESRIKQLEESKETLLGKIALLRAELQQDQDEVRTFSKRRSNLPRPLAEARAGICGALKLDEDELPFAAELIAVKPSEQRWQSSIELVLRPFAISLLVPETTYRLVREYVENHVIVDNSGRGQRLVYVKVRGRDSRNSGDRIDDRSLLNKLDYREDHPLTPWLRSELANRYDYLCCESLDEFDQAPRFAITVNRHMKAGFERHEKDDRASSSDPRNFVLGWSGKEKFDLATSRIQSLEHDFAQLLHQHTAIRKQLETQRSILDACNLILEIGDYDMVDAGQHLREIAALENERDEITTSDNVVSVLKERLSRIEAEFQIAQAERDRYVTLESQLKQQIAAGQGIIELAQSKVDQCHAQGTFESLQSIFGELDKQFIKPELRLETLFARETEFVTSLSRRINLIRQRLDPLAQQIVSLMSRYLREFKPTQSELDATTDSLSSFLGLLEQIREEDLPKHERRFKERLNEKVGQEVALFYASLRTEARQIEEKVSQLNSALCELEYRPGTFMRLEPRYSQDREIAEFQHSMRACLDESTDRTGQTDEQKYLRMEAVINRLADSEKTRWREKVADVRRWFDFAAREIYRATGDTLSYYEDSSGQSGGEKAKLAFTILVAAIAYQYDLDPSGNAAGKFQFVCVDEMFSKVDDRYADYALRLFAQFGLQLLIVAPLDAKARITEPYVDCYAHVVKDEGSNRSLIYSMTAREYDSVVRGFYEADANSIPDMRVS